MNFMEKLVKSFLSTEVPPDSVLEVNITEFTNLPIIARDESLVLCGPSKESKYELILHQPIEANHKTAYSLFRLNSEQAAKERFIQLREVLLPMVTSPAWKDGYNIRTLQQVMSLLRSHPTWFSAHLATKMGRADWLMIDAVLRTADVAELDLRQTPLHMAVQDQNVAIVKALLQLGVSQDVVDVNGNSVYHFAAVTNKEIIDLVMSFPANFLLNAPNNDGKTPLHLACGADKPDCVTALLSAGADVNVAATAPHDSCLPIHCAMEADSATCAKEILQRHPDMLHVQDMKQGGTPLHWAKSKRMINDLVELKCHVNAKNFEGRTSLHLMTKHDRLGCVVALLSHGAKPELTDNDGNTALHVAKSVAVLHALVVFEAPLDKENVAGETPRHRIACSTLPQKAEMLYALHALGAARCTRLLPSCGSGCSGSGSNDGVPPPAYTEARERLRSTYDAFLDDAMAGLDSPDGTGSGACLLSLDGGGIRGLVLIVLLRAVQRRAADAAIKSLFDWIAGTSTGAILAMALAIGRSPMYALGLYFRLKDEVFQGTRPYAEQPLEQVLKREFGEATFMSDITGVNVVVTGVLADRFPADLHLFRNYSGGEELLTQDSTPPGTPQSSSAPPFLPPLSPQKQLVWQAVRASGAAPSYFRAFGRFIDGGLISNNPSLDLLTELTERACVLKSLGRDKEAALLRPRLLLSLGTGRPPLLQVNAIDCFRPESLYNTIQMAFGFSNMIKLLIDQATMCDNQTVDRCRAWCRNIGIRYVRLSPQLSVDVQLDETKDEVLLQMLWETMVYCRQQSNKIDKVAALLLSTTRER